MTNDLVLSEEQQLELTVGELKNIISTRKGRVAQEILEMYFDVGETILHSPLYKKYSQGSGRFIEDLARELNYSTVVLYTAIKAKEQYISVGQCVEQLSARLGKSYINWTDVKRSLTEPQVKEPHCRHCPLHCTPGA